MHLTTRPRTTPTNYIHCTCATLPAKDSSEQATKHCIPSIPSSVSRTIRRCHSIIVEIELNASTKASEWLLSPIRSFFALSAEIRNNIYTLIFEHEDPIYVIQAPKDPNPVLHRCVGDHNRGLINPRKCRSRPSCYTTLDILTFAR
jgi:hypothetical protein